MNKQPTHDLIFDIHYSYHLETMTAILNRRLDRAICFSQLLLGSAVFASSAYGWLLGLLIAVLAAFQFSFKPGEAAGQARAQAFRYQQLLAEIGKISQEEAEQKRLKLEEQDSPVLSSLFNPARQRATNALGYDHKETFSRGEKFFAWLAGGVPS